MSNFKPKSIGRLL